MGFSFAIYALTAVLSLGYFQMPSMLTKVLPIWFLAFLVSISEKNKFKLTRTNAYNSAIAVGLILSSAGDAALFYKGKKEFFLLGLVMFLLAHLCYIRAYLLNNAALGMTTFPKIVLGVFYVAIMYALLPHVSTEMIGPVAVYGMAISTMGLLALNRALASPEPGLLSPPNLALIGSILFMISDSVLALNKFRAPIAHAELIVMVTYYAGQAFIASSSA